MSTLHFLNVGKGDCTLIQHNSGRTSLIDICKGNYAPPSRTPAESILQILNEQVEAAKGNFGMSKKPTNPLRYIEALGIESIFRFVLTHPDMDHLDGLNAMMDTLSPAVFWETGVRKEKPDFSERGEYTEDDWDRYDIMCEGKEPGLTVLRNLAGSRFHFANKKQDGTSGGDGLYILSPDKELVATANDGGEINDASYVLLYRSGGGRILIPGDAHDETWAYVIENYKDEVADCSVLFAPHHGRRSGADFAFLDIVKPKLTFFGCASSGHLAYEQWSNRDLPVVTNNQAGNIVLECGKGSIDIYVENARFATACGCDTSIKNSQGYAYYDTVAETAEVTS